jgi:ketosteroid isomerase-like protein
VRRLRKISWLGILLALAILLGLALWRILPSGREAPSDVARHIEQTVLAAAQAFAEGDLEALDRLFHPDALIFEYGEENRGWADYREHHLIPELESLREIVYRYENVNVHATGDVAWATFDYLVEATDVASNEPFRANGVGTMVLMMYGGAWRIVHLHLSGAH